MANLNLILGIGEGGRDDLVKVNIANPPGLLISGRSGAGKTYQERFLLAQLLSDSDPVGLVMVDPKKVLGVLQARATILATEPSEWIPALAGAATQLINERSAAFAVVGAQDAREYRATGRVLHPVVVMIDELNDVLLDPGTGKIAAIHVDRIARLGRSAEVVIVALSQDPRADTWRHCPSARSNLGANAVCFAVRSSEASDIALGSGLAARGIDASRLIGRTTPGIAITAAGVRYRVPLISDTQFARAINAHPRLDWVDLSPRPDRDGEQSDGPQEPPQTHDFVQKPFCTNNKEKPSCPSQ